MTETIDFPALAATLQENMKPEIIQPERGDFEQTPVAIVPRGMDLKSLKPYLDEYRTKPDRRSGTITADNLNSFIELTQRFKAAESVAFARADICDTAISASITAIFNYHPEGADNADAKFADHKAVYNFPLSKEFKFWLVNNGRKMDQADFALFLEDRILDISAVQDADKQEIENLSPKFADPLVILQLSRDLEIYSNETFRHKIKLSSGETELKFTSENKDSTGQPVAIPDFFVIQLPLFDGGDPERILVRLRYRAGDGKVTWWYELYRVDRALDSAFHLACRTVGETADVPVYFGAPEQKG